MRIEVVFDTVCPWCYIGKRRLEAALRGYPGVDIRPIWRPFLLNPEMPPEGMDRTAYLVRKFGGETRVKRVYGAIADAGQTVEIDFDFERIRRTPNSVDSHRLVLFATRHGKADAAVEALFFNYFINGRDTGDIDVLIRIGRDLGLDADALGSYLATDQDVNLIYEENARAHRMGISSVPSFVFNGDMAISGAHPPDVLARMIDAARAADIDSIAASEA